MTSPPTELHQQFLDCFRGDPPLSLILQRLRAMRYGEGEKVADPDPFFGYCRIEGPMYFIAQWIARRMGQQGYPTKIHSCFRTPEEQLVAFKKGHSKARPFQSAHQFYEACDLVHKSLYWDAPPAYWEALSRCVRLAEREFKVSLDHGHDWKFVDSAHIALADWRSVKPRYAESDKKKYPFGYRVPTADDLARRFKEVLPKV